MNKLKFFLLLLFVMNILLDSFAMPRFSVKLGNKCSDCHYNPTGGIIRNLDGWNWGKNTLSMISIKIKIF